MAFFFLKRKENFMGNPLFNQLYGGRQPMQTPNDGGFANMMASFNQFRQNFRGDPNAEIQKLRASGKMSDQQYNMLFGMAQKIARFIK